MSSSLLKTLSAFSALGLLFGCDYLDTEAFPTFTGEYRLLSESVEFSGFRTDGSDSRESSSGILGGDQSISQPSHFPFAVTLPSKVEVWMSPLAREGLGGYHLGVQVVTQTADGGVSLFKAALDSEGGAYIPLSQTISYQDATSPSRGMGKGYACIWEVSAGIQIQFNRTLSDFYKVYPICTPQEGEYRGQPLCVRPQPGLELDLPVIYPELDLQKPLQMEWSVVTRRVLRADSDQWLCASNPNYGGFQSSNRVKAIYQLETPYWYDGDPRIQDSPDLVRAHQQRLNELGLEWIEAARQVDLDNIYQIPADAFDLDNLYPPVEWSPRD